MRRRSIWQLVRVVALVLVLAAGCSGGEDESAGPSTTSAPAVPPSFTMVELVAQANGPAGVLPIDLDGDGRLELVINEFGDRPDDAGPTDFRRGGLSIYWREGDGLVGDEATTWRSEVIFDHEAGVYFPNDITAADLDDDGDVDLVIPVGFFVCEFSPRIGPCGALFWLEQTVDGWERHEVVPAGDARFFHRGIPVDFDGDGLLDIVTVGEQQEDAQVMWFPAVEPGVFAPEPILIGSGGGSLPVAHDVDGTGTSTSGRPSTSTPAPPTCGSRTRPTTRLSPVRSSGT